MGEPIDSSQVQHMDIAEFRRDGYLQELNRRFLHPLGLALAVTVGADGTERLSGVWDCRDDPEGIRYGEVDMDKVSIISDRWCAREIVRRGRLGYMVQPVDGETDG